MNGDATGLVSKLPGDITGQVSEAGQKYWASIRGLMMELCCYQRPDECARLVLEACWMLLLDIRIILKEFDWFQMP